MRPASKGRFFPQASKNGVKATGRGRSTLDEVKPQPLLLSLRVRLFYILASVGIPSPMHCLVTMGAKSDEILFCVSTQLAARFEMMDLQVFRASTGLAAPAITVQDFFP